MGIRIAFSESYVILYFLNMALLKIGGRRCGMEGFQNMTSGSFNLLSGGNGGQGILGTQHGTTRTSDLKEKRLDSRWWLRSSFGQRSAWPEKGA